MIERKVQMTLTVQQNQVEEINRLHGELEQYAMDVIDRASRLGELLCAVKKQLHHGEWLPWLGSNVAFSERAAQNYMWVFQNRTVLKSANVADLTEAYLMRSKQLERPNGVNTSKLHCAISENGSQKLSASKREHCSGWTTEELKKDEELLNSLKAIDAVYGHDDTKAIRTGTIALKKADVLFLSRLPKEKMLEIQDLVMGSHWSPEKAIKFVNDKPDEGSTVEDLQHWCLATKVKFFSATVGAFAVTCKLIGATPRK
jgi:hypothetical protein